MGTCVDCKLYQNNDKSIYCLLEDASRKLGRIIME